METTQISIHRWMHKQIMVQSIHTVEYCSNKEKWTTGGKK